VYKICRRHLAETINIVYAGCTLASASPNTPPEDIHVRSLTGKTVPSNPPLKSPGRLAIEEGARIYGTRGSGFAMTARWLGTVIDGSMNAMQLVKLSAVSRAITGKMFDP
jgi:hypothetical protein